MRLVSISTLLCLLIPVAALGDDKPANLVVKVEGPVLLQRDGWTGTTPLAFGTVVRLGDLLQPQQGGKATILCADLAIATTGGAVSGVPCKVEQAVLHWNGSRVSAARSANANFPVLLTPRATDILEPRPAVAWTPVSDNARYTVLVEGPNLSWRSPEVTATNLDYPADAPALEQEVDYQVTIESEGRSSRQDGVPGSGFRIISTERLAELRDIEAKIKKIALPADAERLALSHLFADRRLLIEATKQLDGGAVAPSALNFLGEVQLRAQRPDLAEQTFRRALATLPDDDVESGAFAKKMLARLIVAKEPVEAKVLLEDARKAYDVLGDAAAKAEIERLLRVLASQAN